MVLNAKSLLAWFLAQAKPTVLTNAGPDVTPADRARFEHAFDASIARIREGRIDPIGLQELQARLPKAVDKPGVSRETFLGLTEALEKLGGVSPPAEEQPPAVAPAEPVGPGPPAPLPSAG